MAQDKKDLQKKKLHSLSWMWWAAIGVVLLFIILAVWSGGYVERKYNNCVEKNDVNECVFFCEDRKIIPACDIACKNGDEYSCTILKGCNSSYRCYSDYT
ncbi:MAG: hypothetical protein Q8P05_02795 [Candidatus Diapherotrites archaeon]|nr:hypothetical protein [Candidatus Diapherotrites archaeon]